MPEYGLLYFDLLYGEYRVVAQLIKDPAEKELLESIQNKRKRDLLTWDDILTYALIIAKFQDAETLKGKVYSLRAKYQSIIDPARYKDYLALRTSEANAGEAGEKSRSEYDFLIREFCSGYSFIAAHERLRSRLLTSGVLLTLFFFLLAFIIGALAYDRRSAFLLNLTYVFSTLSMVVFAGVTGAFVSMQQRIQVKPNQGDPVHDFSLLTHGWLSIFLSPLSGAIFAIILYLFFAGGLLTGKIFPNIKTPPQPPVLHITAEVEPASSTPVQSNSKLDDANSPSATATATLTPLPTPSPSIAWTQPDTMQLTNFLKNTGPVSGTDYALLLIWSFIAGFAERFVPDSLMRMVNHKKANDETKG